MTYEEEKKEEDIFENWWESQQIIAKCDYNRIVALRAWMIRA